MLSLTKLLPFAISQAIPTASRQTVAALAVGLPLPPMQLL